jgi:hypothetical protein
MSGSSYARRREGRLSGRPSLVGGALSRRSLLARRPPRSSRNELRIEFLLRHRTRRSSRQNAITSWQVPKATPLSARNRQRSSRGGGGRDASIDGLQDRRVSRVPRRKAPDALRAPDEAPRIWPTAVRSAAGQAPSARQPSRSPGRCAPPRHLGFGVAQGL